MMFRMITLMAVATILLGCYGYDYFGRIHVYPAIVVSNNAPQGPNTVERVTKFFTPVHKENFNIEINGLVNAHESNIVNRLTFSLFSSAHASPALEPVCWGDFNDFKSESLEITSVNAISDQYPPHSTLNDLFHIEYVSVANGRKE